MPELEDYRDGEGRVPAHRQGKGCPGITKPDHKDSLTRSLGKCHVRIADERPEMGQRGHGVSNLLATRQQSSPSFANDGAATIYAKMAKCLLRDSTNDIGIL